MAVTGPKSSIGDLPPVDPGLPPASQARFLREAHGSALVFVALALPVFLILAALVIDISMARLERTRLQITADAAALAAAMAGTDLATARSNAAALAAANYPGHDVLLDQDVQLVYWDADRRQALSPDSDTPANAVSVVTRRQDGLNNAVVRYVFGHSGGLQGDGFSLSTEAIAMLGAAGGCPGGAGIYANGDLTLQDDGSYITVCLYGADGVEIDGGVDMDDDTMVVADRLRDIDRSVRDTNGIEADLDPALPGAVPGLLDGLWSLLAPGAAPDRPYDRTTTYDYPRDYPRSGRRSADTYDVDSLSGNRNHVFEKNIALDNNEDFADVYISADGDVSIGNSVTLENVILLASGDVDFGNNATLVNVVIRASGTVTFDNDASFEDVGIYGQQGVSLGGNQPAQNIEATNLQVWSDDDITIHTQNGSFDTLRLRAGDDISFGGWGNASGQTTTATGVTMIAGDDLDLQNNITLRDATLAAYDKVTLEDSGQRNITLGDAATACSAAAFENYIFAGGDIDLGDGNAIYGTQSGGRDDIKLGDDIIFIGSSVEVRDQATVGEDAVVTGCPKTSAYASVDTSALGGGSGGTAAVLVR